MPLDTSVQSTITLICTIILKAEVKLSLWPYKLSLKYDGANGSNIDIQGYSTCQMLVKSIIRGVIVLTRTFSVSTKAFLMQIQEPTINSEQFSKFLQTIFYWWRNNHTVQCIIVKILSKVYFTVCKFIAWTFILCQNCKLMTTLKSE